MLSFSTCWNARRHTSGLELAREIVEMGFTRIELSHGLRAPMVAELLAAREKLGFEISSVHAPCPMPPDILADAPDCLELTSHREGERRRAARLAAAAVETAAQCGARRVVLHAGRVSTLSASARLRAMVEEGRWGSKAWARAKLAAAIRREQLGPLYFSRALEGLRPAAEAAARLGIELGIENRESLEAVPSSRELPHLLDALGTHVFAWHDFGHAQIQEHLGWLDHAQHLDRIGPRVRAAHVHDVKWPFRDHQPPWTGAVPFEQLVSRLPNCRLFVFEMHPRASREDILAARRRWLEFFPE